MTENDERSNEIASPTWNISPTCRRSEKISQSVECEDTHTSYINTRSSEQTFSSITQYPMLGTFASTATVPFSSVCFKMLSSMLSLLTMTSSFLGHMLVLNTTQRL